MLKKLKNIYQTVFFHPQFYRMLGIFIFLFFWGYWFSWLFVLTKYLFVAFALISLADIIYLFTAGDLQAERQLPGKFSNGDNNNITINVSSNYNLKLDLKIIDELPFQFQKRDFEIRTKINPFSKISKTYVLRPVVRGVYEFGKMNVFVSSPLKLGVVRKQFCQPKQVKVYPSFIQMRKYELIALSNKSYLGVKKIRRLGHTMEFEHIKEYNKGDDYRTINWKATAKHHKLMVNQYQDQKSQNVFSVIDMGRMMKMPFNSMTLLDYAINSSLAIANIAMKKKDKAGLITFEKQVHTFLKPDNHRQQLHQIFESLYAQHTRFNETDYERLYKFVKTHVPTRSLLMLYTNFEHIDSLRRQLPFLKRLAKKHLLVVIVFKNTELHKIISTPATSYKDLYYKIIAQDFAWQKRMMIKELQLHNIQAVLTTPENLTTDTINKYLQLKARGLI